MPTIDGFGHFNAMQSGFAERRWKGPPPAAKMPESEETLSNKLGLQETMLRERQGTNAK
jgi:hypothetical protein